MKGFDSVEITAFHSPRLLYREIACDSRLFRFQYSKSRVRTKRSNLTRSRWWAKASDFWLHRLPGPVLRFSAAEIHAHQKPWFSPSLNNTTCRHSNHPCQRPKLFQEVMTLWIDSVTSNNPLLLQAEASTETVPFAMRREIQDKNFPKKKWRSSKRNTYAHMSLWHVDCSLQNSSSARERLASHFAWQHPCRNMSAWASIVNLKQQKYQKARAFALIGYMTSHFALFALTMWSS